MKLVEWSDENACFIGSCPELFYGGCHGADAKAVFSELCGYLLLADISGYTTFLTGTELEHSHAIVTELTRLIRARLVPPMRFVKLEGDAVFCFAGTDAFPDGEQLLELVESCYFDFSSRLLDMTRSTTCTCDACRAIGGLDLKFVVHRGRFIVDRDEDGRVDLAGPDVILAHRLLKNTVIESGGPKAYGFFSTPCFARSSPEIELPLHTESYDSFCAVTGLFEVQTGEITTATRKAEIDGVKIQEGQIIALLNGMLILAHNDLSEACLNFLEIAEAHNYEIITLFYGANLQKSEAEHIVTAIESAYPELEVELQAGGQPHYQFIISIE